MMGGRRLQRGFTLLEVLVAVAVLAVAMGALIKGGADAARKTAYLRDKTIAHWVGMNRVAEVEIAGAWPDTGTSKGVEEMAGREWHWEVKVLNTFDADVRRIEVAVGRESSEEPVARLVAFAGRPPA